MYESRDWMRELSKVDRVSGLCPLPRYTAVDRPTVRRLKLVPEIRPNTDVLHAVDDKTPIEII